MPFSLTSVRHWRALAAGIACSAGALASTAEPPKAADPAAAALAAFHYGFPLNEVMRACDRQPGVNQLRHVTTLATAASRGVVAPNNDTLYSTACLYLASGSVTLTVPPAKGRYLSLQIADAYSNNVAVLGPRELPAEGGQVVVVPAGAPRQGLPAGAPVVELPTPYGFLIARTLVQGTHDLQAAVAAQSGITLAAQGTTTPNRAVPTAATPATDFFLKLMHRLAQNPPPAAEAAKLASLAAAGVRPQASPSAEGLSPELLATWERAYTSGLAGLTSQAGAHNRRHGAWVTSANTGVFGTDYEFRARIARVGLFALPPREAIYFSARSTGKGAPLDGRTGHVLKLPAGSWPPVTAPGFWSLSMYAPDNFFVDNPLQRYAINGFTPGLKPDADGSLTLHLQCTDPGGAASANWLPAPCGPFWVALRLYLPAPAVLDPATPMPAIE
ncbi:MAG: DUF1254 domain-containing protein [Burkholderiales bacterium]|nr:DUF1254 domain-containing protein [Burkholderiales bacterium]